MRLYHQMSKSKIKKTLLILDELSMKFPLLKIKDVNIDNLAKHYNLKGKDILCTYVFILFLKQGGAFISLEDISKLKIKKSEKNWQFTITSSLTKKEHTFNCVYEE